MKRCTRCNNQFEYIAFRKHRCYTAIEWKKFARFTDDIVNGQSLTMQEILIDRYRIILIEHQTRHDHKFTKVPLKEKLRVGLKSLPEKITRRNFEKGMKTFDEGMENFSKEMDALTKGLGGNDKNKPKLWGSPVQKKNKPLNIWSEPVQKKKKRKKSRKVDQDKLNLEKLMGKRK